MPNQNEENLTPNEKFRRELAEFQFDSGQSYRPNAVKVNFGTREAYEKKNEKAKAKYDELKEKYPNVEDPLPDLTIPPEGYLAMIMPEDKENGDFELVVCDGVHPFFECPSITLTRKNK